MRVFSRDYVTPVEIDVSMLDSKQQTEDIRKTVKSQDDVEAAEPIADLCRKLGTSEQMGMSEEAAKERLANDGLNELFKPKPPGLILLFIMQLTNVIIMLLIASACASFVVNATGPDSHDAMSYVEGIAILIIVILNAGIGAVTENNANGALEALSKMSQATATVLRGGKEIEIKSNHIVRGDIVILGTGDVCPADVRLITADELKVREMVLTGEPDDVAKTAVVKVTEHKPLTPATMVFSTCQCTNGKATGVVTKVGMNTRVGTIAAMLTSDTKEKCGCLPDTAGNMTPLQSSLQALGVKVGYGAIATCVVVFVVGVALGAKHETKPQMESWLYMVLVSVTLAVAAIPEGIPLCVTISLSNGCESMVRKNVLVRRLAAVETLGSASVICSDKTGTLTEGKMTMQQLWAGDNMFEVKGKGFNPTEGGFLDKQGKDAKDNRLLRSTIFAGWLCSNCKIAHEKDEATGAMVWVPKGNSSEAPISVAAGKLKFWTPDGKKDDSKLNPRQLEIPFSSSRKMMLTLHDASNTDTLGEGGVALEDGVQHVAIVKGAPNFILSACTHYFDEDGTVQVFGDEDNQRVMGVIDDLSKQALRVLAIAMVPLHELPYDPHDEDLEAEDKFGHLRQDLQLLGLVASIDPDREGVPEAVRDANGAHIRVVMITGDYLETAKAIAKNINIIRPEDDPSKVAVDSGELRIAPGSKEYKSDVEIDKLTFVTKVFARAQPEDKLEIVKSLQRGGRVVAMTGDGVNDAPALNKSDIGVAMGIQGTEVAKGASDMILVDDNFCSIVAAVEKGRVIYAGIQKFVAFIMSVHIGEVLQIFTCVVAFLPLMRVPLQILFLILVTDLPPSIALGMEPGSPGILKEWPRPKTQALVLPWMWQGIVMNGALLSLVALIVYCLCLKVFIPEQAFLDSGTYPRADAIMNTIMCENALLSAEFSTYDEAGALTGGIRCPIGDLDAVTGITDFSVHCTRNTVAAGIAAVLEHKELCGKLPKYVAALKAEAGGAVTTMLGTYLETDLDTMPGGNYVVDKDLEEGPTQKGLRRARTAAFLCVVWCENFRAYTSRQFDKPVTVGLCDNAAMQKAIFLAQVALYLVLFIPVLSTEIMQLEGGLLGGAGWAFGIGGGIACLILCEAYKVIVRKQVTSFTQNQRKQAEKEDELHLSRGGAR
jgi:potassium/sodium efflux P-type ATPase